MKVQTAIVIVLLIFQGLQSVFGQITDSSATSTDSTKNRATGKVMTQPKASRVLKAGLIKNDVSRFFYDVGYEQSIKRHVSFQIDFGSLPYLIGTRQFYGSFFSFHTGLELRYYFAVRKLPLDGFYLGPYLAFNQITLYHTSVHKRDQVVSWPQFGASFGFQKVFFRHLALGVGLKGGYSSHLSVRFYNTEGRFIGGFPVGQPLSIFSCFSVGYKF